MGDALRAFIPVRGPLGKVEVACKVDSGYARADGYANVFDVSN
jgi:hypothetical protein